MSQKYDRIVEVKKYNHNHDSLGRFASGGGGGGLKGSDVRNFGVPGRSGSYRMNAKEKKLAQTIIDNEDLGLKIKDGSDALGNAVTDIHGTREDYETFKEVWNMVAPSTVGKSADNIDHIEEVQKFNPYHDSKGRFTTGGAAGGAGAASAGGGSGEVDQKKWKQNYNKVSNELERMEAKYMDYSEKYDALDAEVRACRRANDAKGEARAKKKMNKLEDEIYDFEQKLHDKRAQFAELGTEAYEIGIIW